MRPAASEDLLTAAPVGRYFVGATVLVWCWSPTLAGTVFWGRPELADVELALRLWEMDARLDRYDSVVDLSRVEAIDAAPLEHSIQHLRRRAGWYAKKIRRGVVIPPGTSVMPAVVVAGMLKVAGPLHPWAAHERAGEAFAWLGHPDAEAAHAEVGALVQAAIETSPILTELRRYLGARLSGASLVGASRELHVSERTLQRTLQAARTSFTAEVDRARVEAAKRHLRGGDDKIESIARAVGCASASHLARVFRRVTGVTPGVYRGAPS